MLGALSAPAFTVAFVWLLTTALAGPSSSGQEMVRFSADSSLIIREIGAVLEAGDDGLDVAVVMPAEARPEGYGDVDVRRGDLVLMINGKRVREIAAAREIFDGTAIGAEIALGIRRAGDSVIARFAKADPESLPDRMVFQGGDGSHGVAVERRMMFEGDGEMTPLLPLGVILETVAEGDDAGQIRVAGLLPIGETSLQEGDVLRQVDGTAVESAQWLVDEVEAAAVGTVFELVVERDGETVTVEQAKSEVQGRVRIGGR